MSSRCGSVRLVEVRGTDSRNNGLWKKLDQVRLYKSHGTVQLYPNMSNTQPIILPPPPPLEPWRCFNFSLKCLNNAVPPLASL